MKKLQASFSGIIMLLLLAACSGTINPPNGQPQNTNTPENTSTPAATFTSTPSQTLTRIPAPTHRPTLTNNYTKTTTPIPSLTLKPGTKLTRTVTATITRTSTIYVRPPILVFWTATPAPFKCTIVASYPPWGQQFKPRTDFVATWKIMNTGQNMWHEGDILFGYVSGTRMHNSDRIDKVLDYTLYAKDRADVQIHMKPPKEPGFYTETWGFRKTNKKEFFCLLSVTIQVVKK